MTTLAPTCVHWWDVEPPTGEPRLRAVCRRCRAKRTFPTVPETDRPEAITLATRDVGKVQW